VFVNRVAELKALSRWWEEPPGGSMARAAVCACERLTGVAEDTLALTAADIFD
jgi:hypothetical protein